MAILLITNIFVPYGSSYASELGLDDLTVKSIVVKQSGIVPENGHLDSDLSLIVDADLSAQIGPGKIQKGDILSFKISEPFLPESVAQVPIMVESGAYTLGTYTLVKNDDGLYAQIVFDGDVFEADDIQRDEHGIATIPFWLTAVMNYDHSAGAIDHDGKEVQIIDKNYVLDPPKGDFEFTMKKSGDARGRTPHVWWTIQIDPAAPGSLAHLDDFRFFDDLFNVGVYEQGSFKIDGVVTEPEYNSHNHQLSYTFPKGFGKGSATITFATKIWDSIYHGSNPKNYSNTAYLYSKFEGETPVSASADLVKYTPAWISKSGEEDRGSTGVVEKDRRIRWTITANGNEAFLRNMYIEDVLDPGLELVSAKYKEWDPDGKSWGEEKDPRIVGDRYYIGEDGHVNDKRILLTLVTRVIQNPTDHPGAKTNFTNKATLGWENFPGIHTQPVKATIGFNGITKVSIPKGKAFYSPTSDDFVTDPTTASIAWKTDVELKDELPPDTKVYEVFLYNDLGYSSKDLNGIPAGLTFGPEGKRADKDPLDRPTSIKQKFSDFKSDSGLTYEVTPITDKAGDRVGDLLTIKGFEKGKKATYFTKSTVVSTALHYRISNNTLRDKERGWHVPVFNTASLFSGASELTRSTADGIVPLHSVYKDSLHRDAVKDPIAFKKAGDPKVNSHFGSGGYLLGEDQYHLAFDHEEKAVIYRLSINPDNENYATKQYFDENSKTLKSYGSVEITDQLMAGWEFVPFEKDTEPGKEDHKYFLMYHGFNGISPDARVYLHPELTRTYPADMKFELVQATTAKGVSSAKFTFPALDRSYVVFLKARPTEEKMKELFAVQKGHGYVNKLRDSNFRNALTFKFSEYRGNPQPPTVYSAIGFQSQPIEKNVDKSDQKDGILTWSLDYRLDGSSAADIHLLDTLPTGIDLPMDAQGQILLESNGQKTFKVTEIKATPDGTYVVDNEAAPIEVTQDMIGPGKMIEYNNATRELTFRAPEDKKAYRFEYRTEITIQNVGNIVNKAKLIGSSSAQASTSSSAFIASIAAGASVERGGTLFIKKTDPNGKALENAKFDLLAQNGNVIRSGFTQSNGELNFRVLPVGTYTLKETAAPSGYRSDAGISYTVEVTKENNRYVTSVKDGDDLLKSPVTIVNHPETIKPKPTGSLLVDNKVYRVKDQTETPVSDVAFEYKIIFNGTGSDKVYTYEKTENGITHSYQIQNDGTISLKHGESFTINGLPEGLDVKVIETVLDGYTVTPSAEQEKTITLAPRQEIHFVNRITDPSTPPPAGGGETKEPKGHLEISNKVFGKDSDPTKDFKYTVTFEGNGSDQEYRFKKTLKDGTIQDGKIGSSGTFDLKDGEKFLIENMSPGLKVIVIEDADVAGDYT
ncbi:MAG: prealbumin-like fold domain-containing protein, partial [Peptostreptococcaceae bacterium]|nr:prealbumin-like fold domain-containing protein [Peptostreptococcaceae bacterium]